MYSTMRFLHSGLNLKYFKSRGFNPIWRIAVYIVASFSRINSTSLILYFIPTFLNHIDWIIVAENVTMPGIIVLNSTRLNPTSPVA